jgi:hypothetical protein
MFLYLRSLLLRYQVCISSWFFLGFGSAAFHATQSGWGEILDEVGMVVAIGTSCLALQDVHPLTAGRRGAWFYTLFMLFVIGSSLTYINFMSHPLFAICFITSVLVVLLVIASLPVLANRGASKLYIEEPQTQPDCLFRDTKSFWGRFTLRESLRMSVTLALCGYGIWHIDQACVYGEWPSPENTAYELCWYYWSHPLWHLLTAGGMFFLLHSIILARIETARSGLKRRLGTGSFITSEKSVGKALLISLGFCKRPHTTS